MLSEATGSIDLKNRELYSRDGHVKIEGPALGKLLMEDYPKNNLTSEHSIQTRTKSRQSIIQSSHIHSRGKTSPDMRPLNMVMLKG
jgi:hypothetical protein